MGIFRMDMKRAFLNKRFVLIVLAAAILWYWNSRRFFLEMDVLGIFFGTVGQSTVVYITMAVCNGVYGLSVCEDMQDHEIKNILCRVSLQKYVISKVLVCVIGTIAVYCLGTFLYLAFELTQYPLVSDSGLAVENLKEITTFGFMLPEHTMGFIFLQTLVNGICCSCMAAASLALSAYIRDGFLVLCVPPVLFFILIFVSNYIIKFSADVESMFWVVSTNQPCTLFFLYIAIFALCFYIGSCILLYFGIRRYEYEA